MQLWEQAPGLCEETPTMAYYRPSAPAGTGVVVIFPGGGYGIRAAHEEVDYAAFLATGDAHVGQWTELLLNWLRKMGWMK